MNNTQLASDKMNKTIIKENNFKLPQESFKQELSRAQQKFYVNSQVRDEKGNLLVCYHGSPSLNIEEFKSDINWFTPDIKYADTFILDKTNGKTYGVYLNCKNLFNVGLTDERVYTLYPVKPYKFSLAAKGLIKKLNITEDTFAALIAQITADMLESEIYKLKLFQIVNKTQFKDLLVSKGYDGIEAIENKNVRVFGVFNRNSIKSTTNLKPTNSNNINQ